MFIYRGLACLIIGGTLLQSNVVLAEECSSWQDLRPYVQKFYELDDTHKDNLVRHFNALDPRTDLHPDRVGYGWFGGEMLVKLYMIQEDCVILDRYYPRTIVWKLMGGGSGSGLDLDKSGKSYAEALAKRNIAQDKAALRVRKFMEQQPEEEFRPNEDDVILDQDIN
ncbi:MAG: hypothetical protein COB59_00550 [Rhodospirillaceae bacterium]|nr:MAG: hypothetical protein COB59_00550 [Rhodospirillaceae bacterium]